MLDQNEFMLAMMELHDRHDDHLESAREQGEKLMEELLWDFGYQEGVKWFQRLKRKIDDQVERKGLGGNAT